MQRQVFSLLSKPQKTSFLTSIASSKSVSTSVIHPLHSTHFTQTRAFQNTAKMSVVEGKFDPKNMVSLTLPPVTLKASNTCLTILPGIPTPWPIRSEGFRPVPRRLVDIWRHSERKHCEGLPRNCVESWYQLLCGSIMSTEQTQAGRH